jgi:hypothetical protein
MMDEHKDWESAARFWVDWIAKPDQFDVMSNRGAVAALRRHHEVLLHEFREHRIGDWQKPQQSPGYLFRNLARIAFPMGAKVAGRNHADWAKVIHETICQRQRKYGHTNVLQGGWIGLVVRVGDKVSRLDNMVTAWGRFHSRDESVADTWLDIVGYSVISAMQNADQFELELAS